MKAFYIFIILNYFSLNANSQSFDSSRVFFNAKIKILQTKAFAFEINRTYNMLNGNCSYRFLESKGFKDVVFFELRLSGNSADSFDKYFDPIGYYRCNFIFGYNLVTGDVYKLKGFIDNDFGLLYHFLNKDYGTKILNSKKSFLKKFYVEGIDLDCLFRWYSKYRKGKYCLKCDCVRPPAPVLETVTW